MKKLISIIAVLIAMCSVFSKAKKSNNEIKNDVKEIYQNKNDYSNITGTPEDSVIFYGGFNGVNDYIFTQIDSNFEPDTQAMSWADAFVSKPVKPGSRYMLEFIDNYVGSPSYGYDRTRGVYNVPTSILIVDVPKEPGLYYIGFYDGKLCINSGELYTDESSKFISPTLGKVSALKDVLKYYRGTAWEPLINEELEKATVERENLKKELKASKKSKKSKK